MGFPLPLFLHRFLKQVILLFCLSFSISNMGIRTLSFLGPILRTNPLLSTEYCDDCHWKLRNRCNPQCAFTRLSVDKEMHCIPLPSLLHPRNGELQSHQNYSTDAEGQVSTVSQTGAVWQEKGKNWGLHVELRSCGAQPEPMEKEEEEKMLNEPSIDIWFLRQKQQWWRIKLGSAFSTSFRNLPEILVECPVSALPPQPWSHYGGRKQSPREIHRAIECWS